MPIGRLLEHALRPAAGGPPAAAGPAIAGRSAARSAVKPQGMRNAGDAGQVGADRIQILQVHRQRVLDLSPIVKAAVGAMGPAMKSTSRKAASKSLRISRRT